MKNNHYKWYGGRGIKVCDRWLKSFENFHEDVLRLSYKDNLTIERINNDGNYEPSNIEFISLIDQAKNRRDLNIITYNGETHYLSEWARIFNLDPKFVTQRINRGWNFERAIREPIHYRGQDHAIRPER